MQLQQSATTRWDDHFEQSPTPHVFVSPMMAFHPEMTEAEIPVHQLPDEAASLQLDLIQQLVFPPTPFVWVGVPKISHRILQRLTVIHTPVLLLRGDSTCLTEQLPTEYQLIQLRTWIRRLAHHQGWPQIHIA